MKVIIEERIAQEFDVEAETKEEAKEIAIQNYYNGLFILDSVDVSERRVSVADTDEWEEF